MCGHRVKLLTSVPAKFAEAWARVQTIIVDQYKAATSDAERDRALKWWHISHLLLLRKNRNRGGQRGDNTTGKLFELFDTDKKELLRRWAQAIRAEMPPRREL